MCLMQTLSSCRSWGKYTIYITLLVIFYIEIISYVILPLQWIEQPSCNSPKCSKVLLIADPQIIGSQAHGHDLINYFAKWDSDRYIRKTFLQVFHYIKPDVVIFLGDLMDEGHISSDVEFSSDLKRFAEIFEFPRTGNGKILKLFVPGDNDIGGIDDIMLPHVVHRFNRIFNQSEGPLFLEYIEFYKINFMTYELQELNYIDTNNGDSSIRIAVSHVPLLPNPTQFLERVVKRVRPHLIVSGHVHLSSHFIASESDVWKRKFANILPSETQRKILNLKSGLIHEIVVPTCSYRMGVKNMGYGAAFIDVENKLLHYNVLWLPRRFIQLYIYLGVLIIYIILFLLFLWTALLKKFSRQFLHFIL